MLRQPFQKLNLHDPSFEAIRECLQRKVSARRFQIFQMPVTGESSPAQVESVLGINRALVYETKHRLGKLFNQELNQIDQEMN